MSKAEEVFKALKKQENIAGSTESLRLQRSIFEGDAWADYPVLASLELAWQEYARTQDIAPDLANTRDEESRDALHSFVSNLEFGMLPPPEALLLIHDALQRYLRSNGEISLDEAFFGKPHKKNSSYAMAWGSNYEKMMAVSLHVALSQISPKKMTQLDAVETMLTAFHQDYDTDPESLLRSWRRWRNATKKWNDEA